MANLILTSRCSRSCPYCFAWGDSGVAADMRSATFDAALDYLQRSGIDEARLLGGEPTAHPGFVDLLQRALRRVGRVTVFTSGLMDDGCLRALAAVPVERCSVVLNINEADERSTPGEWERQQQIVRTLGPRVTPGFTIHRLPFTLDDLLGLYEAQAPQRRPEPTLRIGLAQPGLSGPQGTLSPQHYPEVGRRLVRVAMEAAALGVRLELDCGFVRCMFSDEDLRALLATGARPTFRCAAIVDVWPSGEAHPCFALAGAWSLGSVLPAPEGPAPDHSPPQTHGEHLLVWCRRARLYRGLGLWTHCASCRHLRSGSCSGGCLARVRARTRPVDACPAAAR